MSQETVVREFLEALEVRRLDRAAELLAPDAVWINVSLPTVRGRDRIIDFLRSMNRPRLGFRVHFHNIAADGETVLTERTDELAFGPVVSRFWVWGRFELRGGRIAVWRDSFDWLDSTVGVARGIAAVAAPSLNRPWPD